MLKFKALDNIQVKISLIVLLTTVVVLVGAFAITYAMLTNAMVDDTKDRAVAVNEYIQKNIDRKAFEQLKEASDESSELYTETHILLRNVRELANIQYLYTAQEDEYGRLIYIVDGLNPNNPDFKHIGDSIEEELQGNLRRCLRGEVVHSEGSFNTGGYVHVTYWPVKDSAGDVIGAIGMEFNVGFIMESYRKAMGYGILMSSVLAVAVVIITVFSLKMVSEPFYKKLAYQDFLTSLPNRMAFEERIAQTERRQQSVTMIVYDLNCLKAIDDTHGHSLGDTYLKNSARFIQEVFKELGDTYRIGGDEFATVITQHTPDEVQAALNGLFGCKRQVVRNYNFDCAYGVAEFEPERDEDLHSVFRRADSRMYKNKRQSKDSTV